MRLRRWAYRRGIKRSYSVDVPVICVGNITVGGTGKTPMVAWVVGRLKQAGQKPAILIRGYKSVGGKSDEAELLKELTGTAVIVNPDRVSGAREAIVGPATRRGEARRSPTARYAETSGADALVMDDGFQHLRLKRDLDIVLIDATRPFGGGVCLPVGRLREPLSALRDADAIVITRSDIVEPAFLHELLEMLIRLAPRAAIHSAVHEPVRIVDEKGAAMQPDAIAGRDVCAFCGLGNPEGFFATLSAAGARIVETVVFGDHAVYNSAALERVAAAAVGCDVLVTTAKDRVKIGDPASLPLPLWTLEVQIRITEGEEALVEMILKAGRVGGTG